MPAPLATWALADLELGFGRPDRALACHDSIVAQGGPAAHPLVALFAAPDRAEAAARAEQPAAAQDAHRAFATWSTHANAGWANAIRERLAALVAEDYEAEAHFQAALDWHTRDPRPLAHARTQLLYGEWLRRARRRLDARHQLRRALAAFESLAAEPWAERARAELRATGETARKRDPSTLDQLTPQELQIATLVSDGASNRDVAAKLFLSARTVEYHLYKVFKKLGISSRHELAALLSAGADEAVVSPTA
jgi:DNA-binding CsgD family transcriptional regulator